MVMESRSDCSTPGGAVWRRLVDVTAPPQMEQSADVSGGRSQLV